MAAYGDSRRRLAIPAILSLAVIALLGSASAAILAVQANSTLEQLVGRKWCEREPDGQRWTWKTRNKNQSRLPMEVSVVTGYAAKGGVCVAQLEVNGKAVVTDRNLGSRGDNSQPPRCSVYATVPPGATYRLLHPGVSKRPIESWYELVETDHC